MNTVEHMPLLPGGASFGYIPKSGIAVSSEDCWVSVQSEKMHLTLKRPEVQEFVGLVGWVMCGGWWNILMENGIRGGMGYGTVGG
jgi:hypothetical protein